MCTEFKDLEAGVVQMALEACQYDEAKVRAMLSRVNAEWQSSSRYVFVVGFVVERLNLSVC